MKGSRVAWFPHTLNAGKFFFSVLTLMGIQASLHAQVAPLPQFTKPTVWFGVAGGANFNNYTGTTQVLNDDLTVPAAFVHGSGSGIFMADLAEYRKPDSRWTVMLFAASMSMKAWRSAPKSALSSAMFGVAPPHRSSAICFQWGPDSRCAWVRGAGTGFAGSTGSLLPAR